MEHFKPTLRKPIKSTMWVCVNFTHKIDAPRLYTLKPTRSESIYSLYKDTSYSWEQLKRFGWRCIKVNQVLTSLETQRKS